MSRQNREISGTGEGFLSPSEINARICWVLLRMMTGMLLTLTGLLLGLFGSSVAAAAGSEQGTVSTWPWAIIIGMLVLAILAVGLKKVRKTDRTRQEQRQKVSAPASEGQQGPGTGQPLLSDEDLRQLLEKHIQQCAAQADALAVMAIRPDHSGDQHQSAVASSLHGLAQSRGARLVQSRTRGVIVVAPSQLPDQAQRLAEDLHQSVLSMALPSTENRLGVVTASIGLVVTQPTRQTAAETILARLEHAAKQAEHSGGNRIEMLDF